MQNKIDETINRVLIAIVWCAILTSIAVGMLTIIMLNFIF